MSLFLSIIFPSFGPTRWKVKDLVLHKGPRTNSIRNQCVKSMLKVKTVTMWWLWLCIVLTATGVTVTKWQKFWSGNVTLRVTLQKVRCVLWRVIICLCRADDHDHATNWNPRISNRSGIHFHQQINVNTYYYYARRRIAPIPDFKSSTVLKVSLISDKTTTVQYYEPGYFSILLSLSLRNQRIRLFVVYTRVLFIRNRVFSQPQIS